MIERKYPRIVVIREDCWLARNGCWVAYMLPRALGWEERQQLTTHFFSQEDAINQGVAALLMRKVMEGLG